MVGVEPRVVRVVRAAVGATAEPTSVSKRLTVGEWADMLGRFRHALAAGAIYDRELVQLVEPLGGVLEAFQRRSSRSQALAGGREMAVTTQQYESLAQAAQRTGLSTRTLRRRIAAGLLPAFVSGRRTIRLKVEDVDRMMKPVIQGLMVG